jgi:hypothetical protein
MTPLDTPVVAISGFPGAGKTTLVRRLAAHFGVPAISYDDHETITSRPVPQIEAWIARGSPYDEIDLSSLMVALRAAASQRPRFILLDTLLGRAHAASGATITLSLWLDAPSDIALARKLRAASAGMADPAGTAPDMARWIASYTGYYEQFLAASYVLQRERVRTQADVILSQWRDEEAMFHEAVAAIERQGTMSPARPNFLTAVGRLGRGYGLERSVKFGRGRISDDRYLLTVHKDDLGSNPAARIAGIAGERTLPSGKWPLLMEQLPAADVVHFGHEGGANPVRKVYLEFVERFKAALKAGSTEQQTLYLALKWRPGNEAEAAFSRYFWSPEPQRASRMAAAFAEGYRGRETAPSLRALNEAVAVGAERAGDRSMMLLEVEEEGSGRRSFDVNLYSGKLRGRDIRHILTPLLASYEIPKDQAETALQRLDPELVGHVSAGIGRDGEDFATVYFGLEAREPRRG